MSGIVSSTISRLPVQTVSVERKGTNEIQHRFLRADGKRCVANERPIGVCGVSSTKDKDLVPVERAGIVPVEAGAAIALSGGEKAVQTDASGRAITRTGVNPIAGHAIDAAAAAGDLVRVILP